MTNRTRPAFGMVLVMGMVGCGGGGGSPSGPSPGPQSAPPVTLVVFRDTSTGFSTSDVRDLQDQIVRFNTAEELVWAADGTRFPGYRTQGNFVRWDGQYEVVFVTRNGEQRAYFTVHGHGPGSPNLACDIEIVDGRLVITETNIPLCSPQSSGPC